MTPGLYKNYMSAQGQNKTAMAARRRTARRRCSQVACAPAATESPTPTSPAAPFSAQTSMLNTRVCVCPRVCVCAWCSIQTWKVIEVIRLSSVRNETLSREFSWKYYLASGIYHGVGLGGLILEQHRGGLLRAVGVQRVNHGGARQLQNGNPNGLEGGRALQLDVQSLQRAHRINLLLFFITSDAKAKKIYYIS